MISLKRFTSISNKIRENDFKLWGALFASSLIISLVQLIYLNLRYKLLVDQIPIFYTCTWGEAQLGSKESIFLIPALTIAISIIGLLFFYYLSTRFFKYGTQILFFLVVFTDLFLTYSLFRIVSISLVTSTPLIPEKYVFVLMPFLLALCAGLIFSPAYVKLMQRLGIVTDPSKHDHPAMLLKNPSARGGGLLFALIVGFFSVILLPPNIEILGVLFGALLLAVLGILDDYQNTHSGSVLRFLENPLLRLGLLFFVVSLLYFFNINIGFLANPFNGLFYLDSLNFLIGDFLVQPISWIFTTIWIVWILNLLSWSNGVDGQYGGIVGLALLFIALLALRFEDPTSLHLNYARLAGIAAGASFGLLGVTWHPSKIMWGFGAMSAGLVIASLSTLVQAKVITSILILLIPFLDALATLIRRIVQKRNPLRGDRTHFHHLLIDKGLSVPQIAVFYWGVTLLFGGLSFFSADRPFVQAFLMGIGIVFYVIVLGNLQLSRRKKESQEPEKEAPTEAAPETASGSEA